MFPNVQVEQRQVDTLIGDLPRDALAHVERFFAGVARAIGDHATLHALAKIRERRVAARMGRLDGLGAVVAVLISQGRSLDQITRQLEAEGIPSPSTLFYWKRHQTAQRRIARQAQPPGLMRLAALGWHDRDIGPRVALHPKSVSRIVQRELRKHGESK